MLANLVQVTWGGRIFGDDELISVRINDFFDDRQDSCEIKLRGVHFGRDPLLTDVETPETIRIFLIDPEGGPSFLQFSLLGEYELRDGGYSIQFDPFPMTTLQGVTMTDDDEVLTEFRRVLGGRVETITGNDGRPARAWTFVGDDVEEWHETQLFRIIRDDDLFSDLRRSLNTGIGLNGLEEAFRQRFAGREDADTLTDRLLMLGGGQDAAGIYLVTAQILFELLSSQNPADWLRTANKYFLTLRPQINLSRRFDLFTLAEAERYPMIYAGYHCGIDERGLQVAYPEGWWSGENWKYARFSWTTEEGEEGKVIEGRGTPPNNQITQRLVRIPFRFQVDDTAEQWSYTAAVYAELMRLKHRLGHARLRCTLVPPNITRARYLLQNAKAGGAFNPLYYLNQIQQSERTYVEGVPFQQWLDERRIIHISNFRYALQIWEAVHDITNAGVRVTITCRPSDRVVLTDSDPFEGSEV